MNTSIAVYRLIDRERLSNTVWDFSPLNVGLIQIMSSTSISSE